MTQKYDYVPHKLRSHPFKCLLLPWILVFLVIVYWLALVPVLFSYYISTYNPSPLEKFVFLGCHFVIFVIILALLVCLWKINPVKDRIKCDRTKINFYTFEDLNKDEEEVDNCSDSLKDWVKVSPQSKEAWVSESPLLGAELRSPKYQASENFEEGRPFSQNLEVALTPRELFFLDLYENANKSMISITQSFIKREREYCSEVLRSLTNSECSGASWEFKRELSREDENQVAKIISSDSINGNGQQDVSEYFIANIPQTKSITNEVFIYVADEPDRLQEEVTIVSIPEGDEDIF